MDGLGIESIRALDRSNMLDLLLRFSGQIAEAEAIGSQIDFTKSISKDFNKIVFAGMGGSAIGADLIKSYLLEELDIPIFVNRDYMLPAFVDKKTLLIISSYSGNTEETLSAYRDGMKKKACMIAITTGGKLKKIAAKDGLPCIIIPQGLPPRCALAYSSIPIIILFSKLGLIPDKGGEIRGVETLLKKLRDEELSPSVKEDKNIAKRISKELYNKYPIIYGANTHTDAVATRWRGQLAENAKTVSSTHLFPEMNHNEIVGWLNPKKVMKALIVIMLKDKGDHPRTRDRMAISRSIIEKEGVKVIDVDSRGKMLLERIFSLVYIGDFVSFYLAIQNNVDPTPVDNVTYLKEELAKI